MLATEPTVWTPTKLVSKLSYVSAEQLVKILGKPDSHSRSETIAQFNYFPTHRPRGWKVVSLNTGAEVDVTIYLICENKKWTVAAQGIKVY